MRKFFLAFVAIACIAGCSKDETKEQSKDETGEKPTNISGVDLSASGTANCYIVSSPGTYKFNSMVKGGSTETISAPTQANVLWETFGTSSAPNVGDVVADVSFREGYVSFTSGQNGNAVIAILDANNVILWSWHIWVCKGYDPVASAQVYDNNAGTMMDRNLGATSATPGEVQALGLLYQWGRKDPFLSSSDIDSNIPAASTLSWPDVVLSNVSTGTISYAVQHPTTFITSENNNCDWLFSTDNTRWQPKGVDKGIYDPCPYGWRVPEGGENGFWAKAFDTENDKFDIFKWDSANRGVCSTLTGGSANNNTVWYPASGTRDYRSGNYFNAGNFGFYWSCSPYGDEALAFDFSPSYGYGVNLCSAIVRGSGVNVRCIKE